MNTHNLHSEHLSQSMNQTLDEKLKISGSHDNHKKKCPKIGEQGIFFHSDLSFLETWSNITATDNEVLNFGLPALPACIPY